MPAEAPVTSAVWPLPLRVPVMATDYTSVGASRAVAVTCSSRQPGRPLAGGMDRRRWQSGRIMPHVETNTSNFGFAGVDEAASGRELTYIAAISEALREEMRRDPRVLLLGEDIAGDFGGAFKVTRGLEAEFGGRRVMNTPIAELG